MRFPMFVPRSEIALTPEIGAKPATLPRCHRQRLLLVMHVDGRQRCRLSYLSSAARLRLEARQWTSSQLCWLGCQLLRSGGEDPQTSQIRQILQTTEMATPGAGKGGVKVCDSRRRVALQRATCCSAAQPAHPPFTALPLVDTPLLRRQSRLQQQVSSTQWHKPSALQERHVSCAQKRAFKRRMNSMFLRTTVRFNKTFSAGVPSRTRML